ncbi:11927_t:CDS:1, partial [Gigaspora rosea]
FISNYKFLSNNFDYPSIGSMLKLITFNESSLSLEILLVIVEFSISISNSITQDESSFSVEIPLLA